MMSEGDLYLYNLKGLQMNKAFKVLWNQVRRTYVVASEAQVTHGKPSKATKTIVAAAVAGLLAAGGSAFAATTINNGSFGSSEDQYDSTKFISANGEETIIQTNGDTRKLISAILNKDWDAIRGALGTANGATLVGFTGGTNFHDSNTETTIAGVPFMVQIAAAMLPELKDNKTVQEVLSTLDKYNSQMSSFEDKSNSVTLTGGISLHVGGNGSNPLMIGTVGGDRLINSVASYSIYFNKDDKPGETTISSPKDNAVERNGDVSVYAESGNLVGFIGGSSSLNISNVAIDAYAATYNEQGEATHDAGVYLTFNGEKSSTTLNGNTNIELAGQTSVAGLFSGGSSIALGGLSESIVNGSTHLVINSNTKLAGYEGINAAVAGGGLSVALLGGESQSEITGDTLIELKSGTSIGVLGGGLAIGAQTNAFDSLTNPYEINLNEDGSFTAEIKVKFEDGVESEGGQATTIAHNVGINVGSGASTLGLMGGGLAVAYQYEDATKQSYANSQVDTVTIQIGEEVSNDDVFGDVDGKHDNRSKYFDTVKSLLSTAVELVQSGMDGLKDKLTDDAFEKTLQEQLQSIADVKGVTVGSLGGGLALSWSRETAADAVTSPQAIANVDSVDYIVNSGYNVGLVGGGLALSSGAEFTNADDQLIQTLAQADVGTVTMQFNGGETIGVLGGGVAGFVGSAENNFGVGASAKVKEVNLLVSGGSVDGLVGGGLAFDDTNPKVNDQYQTVNNVDSSVEKVNIQLTSSNVNRLSFGSFMTNNWANNVNADKPEIRDHLDALAYAADTQNAAIIAGGLASGIQDPNKDVGAAHVGVASVVIAGDAQIGQADDPSNVFGGGVAANGALASVGKTTIQIGATEDSSKPLVYGNVYAGGIAQDTQYQGSPSYYEKSTSRVGEATINLVSGELHGNVYTGGVVNTPNESVTDKKSVSEVGKATVNLYSADVFKGDLIEGEGATESALNFFADDYDMKDVAVVGFNTIGGVGANVSNLAYDFGSREATLVTGTVNFASIANADTKNLIIGSEDAQGVVSAKSADLVGATVNVDQGLLAFNADTQTALDALSTSTRTPQPTSNVFVTGTVDLTEMLVTVGDSAEPADAVAGLYVGESGMVIADAAAKTEVKGEADVNQGSIHFVGVDADEAQVTIAAQDDTATTVDNVLYKAVKTDAVYTFDRRTGSELDEVGLGDFDDPNFLDELKNHQDNTGAQYIRDFLDQKNTAITNENRSQQLNAAVNLATAAGVQTAAIDSASLGIDAANKRASIINDQHEGGVLFAEASGRRTEMGGSADFGAIKSELGGVVVGGEYSTGDWTFGALANVGTGSVKGQGNNAGVDNDVDYYGAQIYTGKRFGQFNVVGQVGYLSTSNEISHSTVALNKADVDADVITVGVRGEMRFDLTENTRMVPYIGLNYLRVGTDGYTTSQGVQVGDVDQNLFTLPVGVKYAGDMQTSSGWMWTPSVDVAYVAAFGDRDVDATTHVGAVGQTTMDVWAESVVRTTIGVKAQKENFGFGVEAGGAFGSDDTQGLFGQVRVDYRF